MAIYTIYIHAERRECFNEKSCDQDTPSQCARTLVALNRSHVSAYIIIISGI